MFVKLGLIYITGKIKNFVKKNNIKVDIYYSLNINPGIRWISKEFANLLIFQIINICKLIILIMQNFVKHRANFKLELNGIVHGLSPFNICPFKISTVTQY
jgi:hypothetical protein